MDDNRRNDIVVKISKKIIEDNTPLDEQDASILANYEKFAVSLGVNESDTAEIVSEAFLYLKMQETTDIDPIKQGDQFGAGFS
tara:strand:+ start:711 stop:959 length:249 start_codon:yes stop_codon:yes gene_type:complete